MHTSRLPAIIVAAAFVSFSIADTPQATPVTAPATTAAAADPLCFDGVFAPVEPFEVRLRPNAYSGPNKVTQVVGHGVKVKAGDTLLVIDPTEIDQDVLVAASDLEVAKANLVKEEADLALAEKSDAMTLEQKRDAVADAELNLKWWRESEAADFLKRLDLSLQSIKDSVEDQQDELDQLRKMYKSEQLTNATADIVVKRAVRQLERSQASLDLTGRVIRKEKETSYVDAQQAVERGLESTKQDLESFNVQLRQAKVARAASLLKSRVALREAQKKLSEIEQDKAALSVKSKFDGIAFFGTFDNGAWQGGDADALKADERADNGRVLITVIRPGRLAVVFHVDEARLFRLRVGQAALVRPTATDGQTLGGRVTSISPLPAADGSYATTVTLDAEADARLLPGMKATVELAGEAK